MTMSSSHTVTFTSSPVLLHGHQGIPPHLHGPRSHDDQPSDPPLVNTHQHPLPVLAPPVSCITCVPSPNPSLSLGALIPLHLLHPHFSAPSPPTFFHKLTSTKTPRPTPHPVTAPTHASTRTGPEGLPQGPPILPRKDFRLSNLQQNPFIVIFTSSPDILGYPYVFFG